MATRGPEYPFVPKSTAHLAPGQFWAIPLDNGLFACGRVLDVDEELANGPRRSFWAGLMDWCGPHPPAEAHLDGVSGVIDHGEAHIRTILQTGGEVLGHRSRALDRVEVRHVDRGLLYEGYRSLRPATEAERHDLRRFGHTLGYGFLRAVAERR